MASITNAFNITWSEALDLTTREAHILLELYEESQRRQAEQERRRGGR